MISINRLILLALFLLGSHIAVGQIDTGIVAKDSANAALLHEYNLRIVKIEQQRIVDSIKKADLEEQLKSLKATDKARRQLLTKQLKEIDEKEEQRIALKKARIDSLRSNVSGYPVTGIFNDTLFYIYSKIGASKPEERAINITNRLRSLFADDFLNVDSITSVNSEYTIDISYGETIIMGITESDALWQNTTKTNLAQTYVEIIKSDLSKAKNETRLSTILFRIGLVILVLLIATSLFWLVGKAYRKTLVHIETRKGIWLKKLAYKDYTFLNEEQEYSAILFLLKFLKLLIYAILLYIALPIVFSIFPFTRDWANKLFGLFWKPFKGIFVAVWEYLPNLFTILAIYLVMRYVIKFVIYIFNEIESEKLKISGFHADWAMPTCSIVRFLLYAFMLVLIFPLLPGSGSDIFKGVSVFVGLLISLGSSTAIANIVAGLVITYMRPFKVGDRVRIGEVFGDVEEKTLLVTRIKTIKNEIITIPNSSVLSGNTINYSSEAENKGIVLYTTVTIGYDVPWKNVHDALLEAASRTNNINNNPSPYILQTALNDFYVAYQVNVYTKEVKKQAIINSDLHQNIQDVFNERGIEIMSPHYHAQRDGNATAIPPAYLHDDHAAKNFEAKANS